MFKIMLWVDGTEIVTFEGNDLYDLVLKLNIYREKISNKSHSFSLYQNDKTPTDTVRKEYHNMLYKLMPLARKMVAMGEDFK